MTQQTASTPRIYVACLSAYNAGKHHGCWVNVDDLDSMQEAIQTMLVASPEPDAEEWAIHDYEGFGSLRLSEYAGLERLVSMAELIQEHGELGADVLSYFDQDIDEARESLEDRYAGCFDSLEHFAEQFLEETGGLAGIPQHLKGYIDYAGYGRDMELNGDVFTIETSYSQVHVFWSR